MAGKLVLCRHGQSQWNLENRFTGWVDVDLTTKGEEEALEAGIQIQGANLTFADVVKSAIRIPDTVFQDEFRAVENYAEDVRDKILKSIDPTKFSDAHYEMTPYTFIPKYGKKMSPHLHRDFGQGLLQVIQDVYKDLHPEEHKQHGLLLQNRKKI